MGKISFAHGLIFLDHWHWHSTLAAACCAAVLAAGGGCPQASFQKNGPPPQLLKAAATAPDAADAAKTGGGGGEGAGVDLGFVLQASADNEEVAPSATRDGRPGA